MINKASLQRLCLLAVVLPVAVCCKVDERYSTDADLDLEMTFFGDGLQIPLGTTKQIRVDSLVDLAGETVKQYLVEDEDKNYSFSYSGSFDLKDQLSAFDFQSLADIDAVTMDKDYTYHVGDINQEDFTIEGKTYTSHIDFDNVAAINDINIPAINKNESVNTGLFKYAPGENIDVTKYSEHFDRPFVAIKRSDVESEFQSRGANDTDEYSIMSLIYPMPDAGDEKPHVKFDGVKYNNNIGSISNIRFAPGAKMKVEITLLNNFMTSGSITPYLEIDVSEVLILSSGDDYIVLDQTMDKSTGWSSSYEYDIDGLAVDFPCNEISFDVPIDFSGYALIENACASGKSFHSTTGDISVNVKVYFENLVISSAIATLTNPLEIESTTVSTSINFAPVSVPEQVNKVEILMDETTPVTFNVSAEKLNDIAGLTVTPDLKIIFPEGMEVEGMDANRSIALTGDINSGPISKDIVVKKITVFPDNNSNISFDGEVKVVAGGTIMGTLDLAELPDKEENDIAVNACIKGTPKFKDYNIYLDPICEDMAFDEDCGFYIDGVSSFGTFYVYPEGINNFVLECTVPDIAGVDIRTEDTGVKAKFPDFIVFKDLDPSLNYNPADNSIVLYGQIPHQIVLPIDKIKATPVAEGDSFHIPGHIVISGNIIATPSDGSDCIHKATLESLVGQSITMVAKVPTIKSARIELDSDFTLDIDYESESVTFLASDSIPKELKSLDSVELDNVYANIDITITDLPDLGGDPYEVHLDINLPSYVTPSVISADRVLTPDSNNSGTINIKEKIESLSGIDLISGKDVTGQITVTGTITARSPKIEDISSIKSDVVCQIHAVLGDDEGRIKFGKVSAHVDYDLNAKAKVTFDTMPEVFQKAANLDLRPSIALGVNTNLAVPVSGEVVLTPYKDGAPIESGITTISGIELPYAVDGKVSSKGFYIAEDASRKRPDEFKDYTPIDKNLYSVISQIPDSLIVNVKGGVDDSKACVIDPGQETECNIDYTFSVPIEFGNGLDLAFTTEFALEEEISNFAMMSLALEIVGEITNSTPFEFEVDTRLLDKDGKALALTNTPKLLVKSCSPTGDPVVSPVDFLFNLSEFGNKEIATLELTIRFAAQPGIQLNAADFLQLSLSAILPEGITINPKAMEE